MIENTQNHVETKHNAKEDEDCRYVDFIAAIGALRDGLGG